MSQGKQQVNFDLALGHRDADQPVSWNRRDLLLYAVGIGAGERELDYTYEQSPGFRAFPTYPLVLALKGDGQDTTIFSEMIGSRGAVPGFPSLDPNTIVHGEQSIEVLHEIPMVSGEGWKLKKQVVAIHDKGNALIVEGEMRLVSPVGRTHAITRGATFYRGGGQGTGFSKELSPKPPSGSAPKGKEPTLTLRDKTTTAQAAIYRLSGDYNPLHIDPDIGKNGGLGGCILHGLCSYGFAARAVLRAVVPEDGERNGAAADLRIMSARFTSPVRSGDELETKVWVIGEREGYTEVAFEQAVVGGKKSLGGGYAQVRKLPSPAKGKL
jgi:acyl dehydratase